MRAIESDGIPDLTGRRTGYMVSSKSLTHFFADSAWTMFGRMAIGVWCRDENCGSGMPLPRTRRPSGVSRSLNSAGNLRIGPPFLARHRLLARHRYDHDAKFFQFINPRSQPIPGRGKGP